MVGFGEARLRWCRNGQRAINPSRRAKPTAPGSRGRRPAGGPRGLRPLRSTAWSLYWSLYVWIPEVHFGELLI